MCIGGSGWEASTCNEDTSVTPTEAFGKNEVSNEVEDTNVVKFQMRLKIHAICKEHRT
jgi:hypothetical protein